MRFSLFFFFWHSNLLYNYRMWSFKGKRVISWIRRNTYLIDKKYEHNIKMIKRRNDIIDSLSLWNVLYLTISIFINYVIMPCVYYVVIRNLILSACTPKKLQQLCQKSAQFVIDNLHQISEFYIKKKKNVRYILLKNAKYRSRNKIHF